MSITSESINEGDMTADPEPSEELRFLRDRIAQLERQQTINNSPTSSARRLSNRTWSCSCWKDLTDLSKSKRRILSKERLDGFEQKQTANFEQQKAEQKARLAKMEEYQNKQQQTIDALTQKLKVSVDQFSLKHQEHEKLLNAHHNLMEEMNLKQQQQLKETNDKIGWLNKDQEQCVDQFSRMQTAISDLEHKQKNDQQELLRKMDESLKSVQAMVVAKLGQLNIKK
uniref:Uncharacterized protein n=1 Tax=Globodera rostochiensis TaxID=31243 RepID=A0A914HBJ0_GLORO